MKKLLLLTMVIFFVSIESKGPLSIFKRNVYSQFGEDGIVEKIFEIMGTTSKVAVEFGAWDGFHLSNTALLWSQKGWQGVLIECDTQKYKDLIRNVHGYNCITICAKVGIEPENLLEEILKRNRVGFDIDLLSIDVDGNDYYILESLKSLRPRLIIGEYNPTIPALLDIYPPYNTYIGCSAAALVRVAKQKGYELIAITDTNCFFVRKEDFHLFDQFETKLELIKTDYYLKYIISSYGGEYAVIGEWLNTPYGINGPLSHGMLGDFNRSSIRVQRG